MHVHAADIQDRDGGLLVMATLFGLYPFMKKLFGRRRLPGSEIPPGIGEGTASAYR
jgi:hypothetical protein